MEVPVMANVEGSIDVNRDVSTVYNQWTQFESFPQFMEGVQSVTQLDDSHLHWVAYVAGERREWDAEITEQIPDQRIAWTSVSGAANGGIVTFQSLGSESTKVTLRLDYEPQGMMEKAGDMLGVVERQAKDDLQRFKEFIEARGEETGGWRGKIAV
jgi:uncharacterized membrane protein